MDDSHKMVCEDLTGRRKLLEDSELNGIDYIEVRKGDRLTYRNLQRRIRVYFVKPEKTPLLSKNEVSVSGGVRIQNIRVEKVSRRTDENNVQYLEVRVDKIGDFSIYVLVVDSPAKVDVAFSSHPFSFKAGCPSDFDCHRKIACPEEPRDEPIIDYMAKDFAGFRQALLDLIPLRVPGWLERHEADFGITIAELFSYVADQISYYQDAVANEAYLVTARQRESVKRHARLIDYIMHEGSNARTFIHLKVADGSSGAIPKSSPILSSINESLGSDMMPPHPAEIPHIFKDRAFSAADVIFETVENANVNSVLNEIKIHAWGNRQCCIPRGSTSLDLVGDLAFDRKQDGPAGGRKEAWRIKEGDFLLLEEVQCPKTGKKADSDPSHRQVVRITKVKPTHDELLNLEITRISWAAADKLTFPLCVSAKLITGSNAGKYAPAISVARGNLILADHGQTVKEWCPADPKKDTKNSEIKKKKGVNQLVLKQGPISFHAPEKYEQEEKSSVDELMRVDPRKMIAAVKVQQYENQEDLDEGKSLQWDVVPHLFDSKSFHRHVVIETTNESKANVRFGDGKYGMELPDGSHFLITYRIGNGAAGNIGAETLKHIVKYDPSTQDLAGKTWPDIEDVRNPLPAWGGNEPESIEQVRQLAPKAFHAEQFRAVTESDYSGAAEKHPEVSKAVATFRWTGSWHTVSITIDPLGRTGFAEDLEVRIRNFISRYRLAGYDIEIDPPTYVPLEIEINICVALDHFRSHVKEAALEALSDRESPDGRKGFFHPDSLSFGQPVYLSKLYHVLEQVDGVDSAEVIQFKRQGKVASNEINQGFIPIGTLEIARLDNDPSQPENGVLRLNMMGGK